MSGGTTHMALPAHAVSMSGAAGSSAVAGASGHLTPSGLPLGKRGHKRSVSLENNAPLTLRSTPSLNSMGQTALGSPLLQLPVHGALHTGTLKSRQEQRRLSQKFGSHSNLDDDATQMRSKFQNIRQMFELSRSCVTSAIELSERESKTAELALQSLPTMLGQQMSLVRRTTPIAAGSRLAISEQQQQLQQSGEAIEQHNVGGNFLRPIAFKPIPFEPDYRIASQHQHQQQQLQQQQHLTHGHQSVAVDRYGYGSTPSLVQNTVPSQKFGSTTDLRHLTAHRRGHRTLQRSSHEDSLGLALNLECLTGHDHRPDGANSKTSSAGAAGSDLTPSPSDSGISELEAALKDRDSELSYLRQAMEQNEKDKEVYWEHETQRLKLFYESQQREYQLKFKKMEQLLALQQFQLKQHKLRQIEQLQKLQQQLDQTRCNNKSLKNSEQQLQCSAMELNQQLSEAQQTMAALRLQLEDSEWKVCERNGEIALLKTQLKEAHLEINMKDHAIVSLRHSNNISNNNKCSNNNDNNFNKLNNKNNCKTNKCQSQPKQQAEEPKQHQQQEVHQEQQLQQLNKIIALKDQVIGALTNKLAKLRKELSDLAIAHEYGEEPCGRYTRLKQQLDNLNEICQKTRKYTMQSPATTAATMLAAKTPAIISADETQYRDESKERLQVNKSQPAAQQTLDTLIEESTTYAEDIAKLRQKLDDFRINLDLEKRQWFAEKDKVLCYQKQLQTHYINMYQKLRCLDNASTNAATAVALAPQMEMNNLS